MCFWFVNAIERVVERGLVHDNIQQQIESRLFSGRQVFVKEVSRRSLGERERTDVLVRNEVIETHVFKYDLHRYLEIADYFRDDVVGRQPTCHRLAQKTPADPLIVVLYGLISVNQPADGVPVKNIRLLFKRRAFDEWVVPIRRTNVETLL